MNDATGGPDLANVASIFRPGLLDGQVALVTGGGTGIGLGISQLLAELGAHVVMASRKPANLEAARADIESRGGKVTAVQLDVRDPEQVKAAIDGIAQQLGRIDVLVNNAAGNFYAPSATLSPNAWKSVVEIDLYGTFYCSQAVYPIMAAQGGGRIVSTSMTLHYRGWPMMAHATAAKAGVDALTRTLAVEWAPQRIRVNAIAPGPIPTEGVRKAFTPPADSGVPDVFAAADARMAEYAKKGIPLGRWGSPRDIANMVAFLASPAGDWITGSIFVIDGGEWLAKAPA
ncbi:SDR family oxidoreductase [Gemmatimonas sp.]|uniref:SDR family oxidoreductase n=1 Tax=Gemmatimonas sp. TaxID=1962908 RepID=UPI00286DD8B4|nr:SDR family oxidoreductase [Gemmatimonas sp.]